ncbi:MAG: UvrD-helicase domain-containing protein [Tannerella sp.]|jgi:DNA helicase-2/ATP-dependent DNA helicase PcrA|nr:UvrD-helicase domain-containing protein [Tannerella sp.]
MKDYLLELNDYQRDAVLYDGGPSLVVAGAGSGKTRVLTYKIAHLLDNGYQPHTILALTFTNKASREMKARISAITDEYVTRYLWMGTFHSIFCSILRREARYIGYSSDFTIYDATDSKNLIKDIIKEMQLDEKVYRPGLIHSRISNAKNGLVTSKAYVQDKGFRDYDYRSKVPLTGEIYQRYSARCYNAGVMDFDDLLLQTNILFRDHAEVLRKYQDQFRYVLVDEYQDTNLAQHLIVRRLCENHHRIFVVGDDAQSIYSFRGANIDNMLRFQDNYPTCRVFKLERNYRSTQNIVDAANSLITKNKEQIQKTVYSEKEKGSKIVLVSSYSDYDEAYMVSSKIIDMMHDGSYSFSDFAILYRTNAQSRVLEETLRNRMIKYKVYGAQSFYQRKEIKDVIAYLRVIINPKDEEAMKRIINYPLRGIGGTTLDRLQAAAVAGNVSLWAVISNPAAYKAPISKGTETKIQLFRRLIEGFVEANRMATAVEIAEKVIKESGIRDVLFNDTSVEGIGRLQNVQELLNAINQFVTMRREQGLEDVSLTDFLMEVALITDQDNDRDENADKVSMMTVHAAKGLEFRNVFIVGMENDLFPSAMSMDSQRAIEEERRLFYVAITRAQENCIITFAQNRFRNGQTNSAMPSFFLEDIEKQYLDVGGEIELPAYGFATEQKTPSSSKSNYRSIGKADRVQKTDAESSSSDKAQSLGGFSVGDKVIHTMFGEGEVSTLEGKNENAKAVITFTNFGAKTLLLKYAKLKKVQ